MRRPASPRGRSATSRRTERGTPVGDPVEARELGRSGCRACRRALPHGFDQDEPRTPGKAAAGVAGVIKAALCLKHGVVPAHLHLTGVNPAIILDACHHPDGPAGAAAPEWVPAAGVNSFGYGGTNAHVVLATFPHGIPRDPRKCLRYTCGRRPGSRGATAGHQRAQPRGPARAGWKARGGALTPRR